MPVRSKLADGEGHLLLEGCRLFRGLDEGARRQLASRAHRQRYRARQVIFHNGDPGHSMMAVVAGSVRIAVPSVQGKEIVLADLAAGEVFGEIAVLGGKERSADAVALTNCELMVLERRDVLPFLERHPEVCLKLLDVLCDRLRSADVQLGEIAFLDLPSRLAKSLLRAAHQASVQRGSNHSMKLGLSQRELGSMIGGTRESVNRCLRQWATRQIIRLDKGWIFILAPEALEKVAAPD